MSLRIWINCVYKYKNKPVQMNNYTTTSANANSRNLIVKCHGLNAERQDSVQVPLAWNRTPCVRGAKSDFGFIHSWLRASKYLGVISGLSRYDRPVWFTRLAVPAVNFFVSHRPSAKGRISCWVQPCACLSAEKHRYRRCVWLGCLHGPAVVALKSRLLLFKALAGLEKNNHFIRFTMW